MVSKEYDGTKIWCWVCNTGNIIIQRYDVEFVIFVYDDKYGRACLY